MLYICSWIHRGGNAFTVLVSGCCSSVTCIVNSVCICELLLFTCSIKPKDPSKMTVKELKAAIRHHGLHVQAAGFCEKQEFVALLEGFYASML